jgi:hypothetical protein
MWSHLRTNMRTHKNQDPICEFLGYFGCPVVFVLCNLGVYRVERQRAIIIVGFSSKCPQWVIWYQSMLVAGTIYYTV